MILVAQAQIESQIGTDFPVVLQKEFIHPTLPLDEHRGKVPACSGRGSKQEVGIGMTAVGNSRNSRVGVAEGYIAEQAVSSAGAIPMDPSKFNASFECVLATE